MPGPVGLAVGATAAAAIAGCGEKMQAAEAEKESQDIFSIGIRAAGWAAEKAGLTDDEGDEA